MSLDVTPCAGVVDWVRCTAAYNAGAGLAPAEALGYKARTMKLELSDAILQRIHAPIVDEIVGHVRGLLHRVPSLGFTHMLIVGGFARSTIVYQALKALGDANGVAVVLSSKPAVAVVCGAVRYGLNPNVITHRTPRYTLGVTTYSHFAPGDPIAERVAGEDGVPRMKCVRACQTYECPRWCHARARAQNL